MAEKRKHTGLWIFLAVVGGMLLVLIYQHPLVQSFMPWYAKADPEAAPQESIEQAPAPDNRVKSMPEQDPANTGEPEGITPVEEQ